MKQVAKFTLATIGILSVAGCMGSNSGATGAGAGGGGDFANKAALEELQARTVFQSTPIAALPTSSTASYTGFVQLAEGATDIVAIQGAEVVGTATFEVGFAGSGSFTGSATNFQDALGDYTGTLTIGSGTYGADPTSSTGARVDGDIAGTLTRESGEEIAIAGDVVGRFFDTEGAFLVGGSTGTATLGGDSTDIEIFIHGEKD